MKDTALGFFVNEIAANPPHRPSRRYQSLGPGSGRPGPRFLVLVYLCDEI
jgi:hypothetical protein